MLLNDSSEKLEETADPNSADDSDLERVVFDRIHDDKALVRVNIEEL